MINNNNHDDNNDNNTTGKIERLKSKNKYVAYVSVLSQILNCQGLGRKNKHEILRSDCNDNNHLAARGGRGRRRAERRGAAAGRIP